jgi:plastocyanin
LHDAVRVGESFAVPLSTKQKGILMHQSMRLWGAGALTVVLVACGGTQPEVMELASDVGPITGETTIAVVDNDFEPDELVVEVGTEVSWEWRGQAEHNVLGPDFESPLQSSGTFTHTFDREGTYTFVCGPHGGMTGTIHVVP